MLARLWADETKSGAQKRRLCRRLQLAEVRAQPAETFARSGWQSFDANTEKRRAQGETRDTFLVTDGGVPLCGPEGKPMMKPLNVLVHERMAERPFVPFAEFDIAAFVDYGQTFYDNNRMVDGQGRNLRKPRSRR